MTKMIFVVDDDPMIIRLYKRMLGKLTEYRAVFFYEARHLLKRVEDAKNFEQLPVLVITDCEMPEMNGIELATALWDCQSDIPILMVSGKLDLKKPKYVDALLKKPFETSHLTRSIDNLLRV